MLQSKQGRQLVLLVLMLHHQQQQRRQYAIQTEVSVNLEKKLLTFERLILSLKSDKLQLCVYIGLYVGLFVILYSENGIRIAILGSLVPLTIGVNSLLVMDLKHIASDFSFKKFSNITLVTLVLVTNGLILWFAWPNWILVLMPWLIPLVLKIGIDGYLKFKS